MKRTPRKKQRRKALKKGRLSAADKRTLAPYFKNPDKNSAKHGLAVIEQAKKQGRVYFKILTEKKVRLQWKKGEKRGRKAGTFKRTKSGKIRTKTVTYGKKRLAKLNSYFDIKPLKGQKGVFLPSKFAGRKLKWNDELDAPIFTGGGAQMTFYPAPNFPLIGQGYYEAMGTGEADLAESLLGSYLDTVKAIVTGYVEAMPEGEIRSIVFGGTDILSGVPGNDDKQALIDEIMDMFGRVIYNPDAIAFWEGVLGVKPLPETKKKAKKRK